jgi:thiol-disulfide isomerase/thioredoxin
MARATRHVEPREKQAKAMAPERPSLTDCVFLSPPGGMERATRSARPACAPATRRRLRVQALFVLCVLGASACPSVVSPALVATTASPFAASVRAPVDVARLHVLMINGGGRPAQNYQSHLLHVQELLALLRQAGVQADQISIFNADGSDPAADLAVRQVQPEEDFWLLRGTHLEGPLRTHITYANSEVAGARLEAATRANITAWFGAARERLRPGDTLLLYVTDHGTKGPKGQGDSRITLWGDRETLAVSELRPLLAQLDPGVRVVALMSQCFSGGFADLMSAHLTGGQPRGDVCGYFSSTADRPAYGCYPESLGPENIGHSFDFLQALRDGLGFPDAQAAVLVADRTPDVPLTSGDVYLADLVRRAAEAAGQPLIPYVDQLLDEAWRDKGASEPQILLVDRIGQAFGIFSPRSLAELEDEATHLSQTREQFTRYSNAWRATRGSLAEANLTRFLAARPDWARLVNLAVLAKLDPAAQRALTAELLSALASWTRADRETHARLALLREKSEVAAALTYRMEVRLAVVLRMRTILTDVAGQVYLATRATPAERAAYDALRGCEDLTLNTGAPLPGRTTLAQRQPFPRFEEDLRVAEQILPGWMGIRFTPLARAKRVELGLAEGAASVATVYPGSPAEAAGFEVGDIVIGPPHAPFTEPNQIREWTMLSRIDEPAPLEVLRGSERIEVTLIPKPFPRKWPALPGPPEVASAAPPLTVTAFRGQLPATLADGTRRLLFFWATWCAPCKASLPELLAYETATHTPVIAITDEPAQQLTAFFQRLAAPFPKMVAIDELRRTFLAYGLSGTPTFVLVDGRGIVRSYSVGYDLRKGLGIHGWIWRERPPA